MENFVLIFFQQHLAARHKRKFRKRTIKLAGTSVNQHKDCWTRRVRLLLPTNIYSCLNGLGVSPVDFSNISQRGSNL